MGYMHIENLYKNKDILLFKKSYALEKIHGTSAHIVFYDGKIGYYSGGEKFSRFISLFDSEKLLSVYNQYFNSKKVILFGEAYGGSQQGMSKTYGKDLKFIVFDVKIDEIWLNVPDAEEVTKLFELEFVSYNLIDTDYESLTNERDKPSIQAVRNGITEEREREGIVLRPLMELRKNNGDRIIAKYKNNCFSETVKVTEITQEKLDILSNANEIANNWVTINRVESILSKHFSNYNKDHSIIPDYSRIILEDIEREGKDEIEWSKDVKRAVSKKAVNLYKQMYNVK